jgi:hypothetical protein
LKNKKPKSKAQKGERLILEQNENETLGRYVGVM